MKTKLVAILLLFLSFTAFAQLTADPVDVAWDEGPIKVEKGNETIQRIDIRMQEGLFTYADKTDLEFMILEGIHVTDVKYPAKEFKIDPMGGAPVAVYTSGEIIVEMQVPEGMKDGTYEISAVLHYQPCSDKLCMKPGDRTITWKVQVGDGAGDGTKQGVNKLKEFFVDLGNLLRGRSSETVLSINLNLLFIMAFLGGILSSVTPCVLPMIPITLLIIGVHPGKGWRSNFGHSFMLVFGMSITYSLLGLLASAIGRSFGFVFQSRLFLVFVIAVFFLMGLSLMGVYTMQLPSRFRDALSRLGGKGPWGAFLAGISMGLLATPCVGPVLGALLVYAASAKGAATSFLLLLIYSIGLGTVIIIAGTWYGTVVGHLKKARVKWVKKFIGMLLILSSLYYLHSLIPYTLLFTSADTHPIKWQRTYHTLSSPEADSRPKMLLFTAEWCPPCKILKVFALKDSKVVALSEKFTDIMVDMTTSTMVNEALVRKYGVMGWPTLVFLSPKGDIYNDLTISGGFITVGQLADHMERALARAK